MHYHCEIIMPPSPDIKQSIDEIMSPFYEGGEDACGNEFFDFYVIGGRWAGTKETCRYDVKKIEQFFRELKEKKITVSCFQCGKQELKPKSQIPLVDTIWSKYFPTENGEITPCPMFAHSNNQYDSNDLLSCDICRVDEIPPELSCDRIIFAAPGLGEELRAKFMLCSSQWNGVNNMPIDWDWKVHSALEMFEQETEKYKNEDYKRKITPMPDWLCITVDYHSQTLTNPFQEQGVWRNRKTHSARSGKPDENPQVDALSYRFESWGRCHSD